MIKMEEVLDSPVKKIQSQKKETTEWLKKQAKEKPRERLEVCVSI
jgi:hypothetical protein